MKILHFGVALTSLWLAYGVEVDPVGTPSTSSPINLNKTDQWSSPDTSGVAGGFSATHPRLTPPVFPTEPSGAQASSTHHRLTPPVFPTEPSGAQASSTHHRLTPPVFPTEPSGAQDQEGPYIRQIPPQHKPESNLPNEYLKTLQQKHKKEAYTQYNIEKPKSKVIFETSGYKPIKFEDDYRSSQERAPVKGYNVQAKEPYPYQYVNSYSGDRYVEPAPTASAHQSVSYNSKGSLDMSDGGKKVATTNKSASTKKKTPWEKAVRLLAAFIPLGLFLAALPPNVLNINSTNSGMNRQRAEDGSLHPAMELFDRFGFDSLEESQCENRMFCEISRMGGATGGSVVQQGFWQLAHDTPDSMAELLGFKDVFGAIRNNDCNAFYCPDKKQGNKAGRAEVRQDNTF